MEMNRRTASGTLSEILGKPTLNLDRYLRTLGLRRVAEQDWAKIDDESRAILEAYAAGVNAYIGTHRDRLPLEFTILGVDPKPWTPVDTLVWGNMMALSLGSNKLTELLRMQTVAELGAQVAQQLFPLPAKDTPLVIPDLVDQYHWSGSLKFDGVLNVAGWLDDPVTLGRGSNAWVVHGSHSATNMPLLANDVHLDMGLPSIWYENGLHGGRFDSTGFTFPGVPLVVIGHNSHIAWGLTNLGADVEDLYVEKLDNPTNPKQYEFMGEWHDLKTVQETINVKGQNPVVVNVLLTQHGPIINDAINAIYGMTATEPLALRWTLYEGNTTFRSFMQLDLAANWDEFHQALSYWNAPSQNFVYADVNGNVGYQASGKIPIRTPGHQGTLPVPGWTGQYEWQGFIPSDRLPSTFDPPAGFVVTANNKVVPDDYPYSLSFEWLPDYRARRITDLLATNHQLSITDMKNIQADTYSLPAEALRPYLLAIQPENDLQAQALAQVKTWDLKFEPDRVGASIYQVWFLFMLQNTLNHELGQDLGKSYLAGVYEQRGTQLMPMMIQAMADPNGVWFDNGNTAAVAARDDTVRRSLTDAVNWLSSHYGNDPTQWTWGRIHTVTFKQAPLGQSGNALLELIFDSPPIPARGEIFSVDSGAFSWSQPFDMLAGTSQRMIIDLSNFDDSLAINSTGQSGQLFDPNREDQISLWQNVEYHPMLFSRQAVEAHAAAVLTLTPQ